MVNISNNIVNVTAQIQLASNLGLSTNGSDEVNVAVAKTSDSKGRLWAAIGWDYTETTGILTVYFNAVPADDGVSLLVNIQTVYPTATLVVSQP